MSDSNTSTVNHSILESCNGSYIDTTPVTVSYPELPNAVGCDTSPVHQSPGTASFESVEYASFADNVQEVTACPIPTHATAAPTIAPATIAPTCAHQCAEEWFPNSDYKEGG